eukprot:31612_1
MGNKKSKTNKHIVAEQAKSSQKQTYTNQLSNDLDEFDEKQADESCSSIATCKSINVIIKYLKTYQDTKLDNLHESFNKKNIAYLQNSFNHILIHHLGDKQSTDKTTIEYEKIYDFMTKTNDLKCSLKKCIRFQRNNRNR